MRQAGKYHQRHAGDPTFEFFLKDDDLGDPMINDYHIESFGWAEQKYVDKMKEMTFAVNDVLKKRFQNYGSLQNWPTEACVILKILKWPVGIMIMKNIKTAAIVVLALGWVVMLTLLLGDAPTPPESKVASSRAPGVNRALD